jgi:transcriptional regulator with XRE-family HTH domain
VDDNSTGGNVSIGAEVKDAILAAGFTVKSASERAHLNYRTVARYISGERDMPVSVLLALMSAIDVDFVELAIRLQKQYRANEAGLRAYTDAPKPGVFGELSPEETGRRLSLVLEVRGRTAEDTYESVAQVLNDDAKSISYTDWILLMDGAPRSAPHADVLFVLAKAFDVSPDYLLRSSPSIRRRVEAQLEFDGKMRILGVNHVATRSLTDVDPAEFREAAEVVIEIVTELRLQ